MNCEQLATTLLAAEAVGIAVPINPALAASAAEQLFRLAGARVLIASGPELDPTGWQLARSLAESSGVVALLALRPVGASGRPPKLEPLEGTTVDYLEERATREDGNELSCEPPVPSDFSSYLHTGGTTGTPKLAARTHANEVANAWMIGASLPLDDDVSLFAALPLFHTNALLVSLLAPLLRGHHVLWAGPLGYREPTLLPLMWRLIERYRVAVISGVPTSYAVLAQQPLDADVSTLRFPLVGAAPLPGAVAEAFRARTGVELCEGYGLTEGTCASARNFPTAVRRGSVGQRLPYQNARAVRIDPATGRWHQLEPGEVGNVVISGPNIFSGYLRPSMNGPVADPGDKVQDGWLDTGDLGSVDADGFLTLVGRVKDLIIRGGHNIDPASIEDALLEHPDVTAAAAVGYPDEHSGEVPAAYVVLAKGASADQHDLTAWAATHVVERAAVPKHVEIVDEIPLTAVGKPYKPELRRRAAEAAARERLPPGASVRAEIVNSTIRLEVSGMPKLEADRALAPLGLEMTIEEGPDPLADDSLTTAIDSRPGPA